MQISPNFVFLRVHDLQLVKLGSQAEKYFSDDPNTCLIKLRQFGEVLAQLVAAKAGLYERPGESQYELLNRLKCNNAANYDVLKLFHNLRQVGNDATHKLEGDKRSALSNLKYARTLGIWFHKSYGRNPNFRAGPFVPPVDTTQQTANLKVELDKLKAAVDAYRASAEAAAAIATEEAELRQIAEQLLEETEAEAAAKKAEFEAKLATIQAETKTLPKQEVSQVIATAQEFGANLDLDERETRRLIDQQLRDAGWEVDTEELRYSKGVRPQKGKYLAIAEWPTSSGPVDYALFNGLSIIGVVEAKRISKDVLASLEQAKRYSRDFKLYGDAPDDAQWSGGPWGEYRVPFVFATNGREFLEQLRTKSGIWFRDVRRSQNPSRPLNNWYSPQDLVDALGQDQDEAHQKLDAEDFEYNFQLRPYQKTAIQRVEAALAQDARRILLAMATGTGKTKTSITLVYRLLKAKRFRRILFLVDRTALGRQTEDAFNETRMESLQTFADIFDIKGLKQAEPDRDTKVHIATVQGMVKRLLYPSEGAAPLTAGQYDCIVVDECHRGYLLDREMSEAELTFRDLKDYVSKYRRVLDFFDAVKVGLTATPALHTTEIFGDPVFVYSYREAVIDGWLIDQEPPIRITTALSEDGIKWRTGEEVAVWNPHGGQSSVIYAPDDIHIEVEQFNRKVVTVPFNRVVCEQLAQYVDPELPEKTLIFCVTDAHADIVVDQLRRAFTDQYGEVDDDAIVKITGAADKPLELIRKYRNEVNPKIAVTVDLLTTGIDVPKICNLVFIRRVNSRILYEQMLGRATRRCDEIGKQVFRVFDAVNLYENIAPVSTMKPVVVNPQIPFSQLVNELGQVTEPDGVAQIIDQLLAKLQRKRQHLSEAQREGIEQLAGMEVDELPQTLRQMAPADVAQWFQERTAIAQLLDRKDGGRQLVLISHHPDELRRVEQGYGEASKPEDYLSSFETFLQEKALLHK